MGIGLVQGKSRVPPDHPEGGTGEELYSGGLWCQDAPGFSLAGGGLRTNTPADGGSLLSRGKNLTRIYLRMALASCLPGYESVGGQGMISFEDYTLDYNTPTNPALERRLEEAEGRKPVLFWDTPLVTQLHRPNRLWKPRRCTRDTPGTRHIHAIASP